MTIDEVHRLVVAANPVPDPEMLEPVEMPDLFDEREGSTDMSETRNTRMREGRVETTTSRPRLGWRWSAIATALAGVVLIAGVALVRLAAPNEGLIAGQPPGVLDDYVAALQVNDVEAATAVLVGDVVTDFTPWLIGTDASTFQVSACEMTLSVVRCTAHFGPAWFYSRITGDEWTSSLIARIEDDGLDLVTITAPPGVYSVEAEFEAWIRETYPERHDVMYNGSALVYSYESGAARSELAEEYVSSRE